MKLDLRTPHLDLTPEARDEMRRRLATILDRLRPWIRAVTATITDINGPRGGADKQCRLHVRGRSTRSVVVEHVGMDALGTLVAAATRAAHVVTRKMARARRLAPGLAS